MKFTKKKQIAAKDLHIGCLTCSTASLVLDLRRMLCVGFGRVTVTKDGKEIWSGDDENKEAADIEQLALKNPEHDWRIEFYGPMHGETFQRHGKGNWVCIESNRGFA